MNWTVIIMQGLTKVKFGFSEPQEATAFVKKCLNTHIDSYNYKEEKEDFEVTIEVSREEF